MKLADLSRKVTKKVAEYISNGYSIVVDSTARGENVEFSIDLSKPGCDNVRIYIEKRDHWKEYCYYDYYVLVVGTYSNYKSLVLFNDKLENVSSERYWIMKKGYRNIDFLISDSEFEAIRGKIIARKNLKLQNIPNYKMYCFSGECLNDRALKIAMNIVKKIPGYKRTKAENINRFIYSFNDNRKCFSVDIYLDGNRHIEKIYRLG